MSENHSRTVASPLKAGGWATASITISYIIGAVLYLPLAYFLTPRDFGLYATAGIYYTGFTVIIDLTLVRTLVRTSGSLHDLAQAAFWLSVLVGLAGGVLSALLGFPLAALYNEPQLVPLMLVLSLGVLAVALGTVPHALLSRELDFRRKLIPEASGVIIGAAVAMLLAVMKAGVYSLITYQVVRLVVNSLLAWFMVKWRPLRQRPDKTSLRRLFSFGWGAISGELALYARFNIDSALSGLRLGQDALGVYTMAWNTSDRPALFLNAFFGNVGYASFSRLLKKTDYLKALYTSVTRLITSVALPLFLMFALLREEVVAVVFMGRWQGIIPLLLPLVFLQALWVIFYPSASLVLALGYSRLYAIFNVISLGFTALCVWYGSGTGTSGVAWGMLLAVGTTSLVWGVLACAFLRFSGRELWDLLKTPLLLCLITLPGVLAVKLLAETVRLGNLPTLGLACVVGLAAFAFAIWLARKTLREDLALARRKLPVEETLPDPETLLEGNKAVV